MIINNIILLFWKCILWFHIQCMLNYKIVFWIMGFGSLPNLLNSCNSPLFFLNFSKPKIIPIDKHPNSSSKPALWLVRLPMQSWCIYILIFYIFGNLDHLWWRLYICGCGDHLLILLCCLSYIVVRLLHKCWG